jgi:transposase
VFLDESGFSERSFLHTTWAPKGKTPILVQTCNWKKLSAIAALVTTPTGRRVKFFLRLLPGNVRGPQVKSFLMALQRHFKGRRLILLWDRLRAHRGNMIQQFLKRQKDGLTTEYFPTYAPELNPVEYFWAYVSGTDLANFCADYLSQVRKQVHKAAGRVRHRLDLGQAFLKHSGLF